MNTVNHIRLRAERSQAKAILRYILFAIFFHRHLDNVEPETEDFLDAHVAYASSRELEKEIATKTEEFSQTFIESGATSGELAVVFLQRKNRKGWFAVTEELVPWEEHLVTIDFASSTPPGVLTGALFQLVSYCSENKANVPPLVGSGEQNNLSHQILVSPPPPSELFAPTSPPLGPVRILSTPPAPVPSTTTTAIATAKDLTTTSSLSSVPSPAYGYGYSGHGHGRQTSERTVSGSTAVGGAGADTRRASAPMIGLSSAGFGGGGGGGGVGAGARTGASTGAGTGTTAAGAMGYLEQAKDGLLAVGAKAGAGVGWGGRAVGAAFSRSGNAAGGGGG